MSAKQSSNLYSQLLSLSRWMLEAMRATYRARVSLWEERRRKKGGAADLFKPASDPLRGHRRQCQKVNVALRAPCTCGIWRCQFGTPPAVCTVIVEDMKAGKSLQALPDDHSAATDTALRPILSTHEDHTLVQHPRIHRHRLASRSPARTIRGRSWEGRGRSNLTSTRRHAGRGLGYWLSRAVSINCARPSPSPTSSTSTTTARPTTSVTSTTTTTIQPTTSSGKPAPVGDFKPDWPTGGGQEALATILAQACREFVPNPSSGIGLPKETPRSAPKVGECPARDDSMPRIAAPFILWGNPPTNKPAGGSETGKARGIAGAGEASGVGRGGCVSNLSRRGTSVGALRPGGGGRGAERGRRSRGPSRPARPRLRPLLSRRGPWRRVLRDERERLRVRRLRRRCPAASRPRPSSPRRVSSLRLRPCLLASG